MPQAEKILLPVLVILIILNLAVLGYLASIAGTLTAKIDQLSTRIESLEGTISGLPSKVAEAVSGAIPTPPPTPAPTPTLKTVELTIEYGQPWEKPVSWVVDKFKEAMKEKGYDVRIKLAMLPYGVDFVSKESMDFATGTAGDVVLVDSFMIPEYAAAGYLEPLDTYVAGWADWSKFPEPMRKIVMYEGRVYGVMMDTDVRMIWYRKDIFKMAGLPEDWQPKTWDDIIQTALTLKEHEAEIKSALGIDEFYPFYIPAGTKWGEGTTMQGFYMVLLGADDPPYNRLYDYKAKKWIGKSTALYRAFKFYYDVYVKYKLGPVEYNFAADVWATHRKVFAEGKVAMDVGGSWEWGEGWGPNGIAPIPDREAKVGYAKMPGYKGGFVTISGGWAWVINAKIDSEKKELAWEFIKMVCSKEIIAKYAAEFGKVAPRSDAAEVPEYAKDPYLKSILEYLTFTDFRDAMPGYSKVSSIIQEITEKIITEGIAPDQALEEYYNRLVAEFGEGNVITYQVVKE